MWEIVNLGDVPYPGVNNTDLMNKLKEMMTSTTNQGALAKQSKNIADGVYGMMRECWSILPTNRPTFEELQEQLEQVLTDNEDYVDFA